MNHTSPPSRICVLVILSILFSCKGSTKGSEYEAEILEHFGVRSSEYDSILSAIIPQINLLLKEGGSDQQLELSADFQYNNINEILLIPIVPFVNNISASSNIENRFILINPNYVNNIIYEVLLDPDGIKDIFSIILIHEMCHFELNTQGMFDEFVDNSKLKPNEIPNHFLNINSLKVLELKVDSLAISHINNGLKSQNINCSNFSNSLKKQLPILEGTVFANRLMNNYGTPDFNLLTDLSKSHPNFELRLAFMNYYLNPTDQKKKMLEIFIKEREIRIQK